MLREVVQVGPQDRGVDELAVARTNPSAQNLLADAAAEISFQDGIQCLQRGVPLQNNGEERGSLAEPIEVAVTEAGWFPRSNREGVDGIVA